ncbi:MAG: histone deacetylase [bacterium]
MRPTLLTHPACLDHLTGIDHPERPARLAACLRGAATAGLVPDTASPPATRADLLRVHDAGHVDRLLALAGAHGALDDETLLTPGSVAAALQAAGIALDGARRLMAGQARQVLALVRPPGHHAERARGLGFCLVNHIALAAAEARRLGAQRVAIVDIDAHFGNGTQAIHGADPRVLLIDLHEDDLFPPGGSLADRGVDAGEGFTLNLPLLGAADRDYRALLAGLIEPALARYRPQMVLISLGFDAHQADPLASLRLSTRGFGELVGGIAEATRQHGGDRLLLLLEGGYDLAALEASTAAVARALQHPPALPAVEPGVAAVYARRVAAALAALDAGLAREEP